MKTSLIDVFKSKFQTNVVEVEVKEEEDYTDEIIKSLYDLKEAYDIPTEEVELAVISRKPIPKKANSRSKD